MIDGIVQDGNMTPWERYNILHAPIQRAADHVAIRNDFHAM
jgi:hypothetical protein